MKRISIICQYCFQRYKIENSKSKAMRDWNIDSSVCNHCGIPRIIHLMQWGELRECKECKTTKPIGMFHNNCGRVCRMCHAEKNKKVKSKSLCYNIVNANNKSTIEDEGIGGRTNPTRTQTIVGEFRVQETSHGKNKQGDRFIVREYRKETTTAIQHSTPSVIGYVRKIVLRQGNGDIHTSGVEDDKRGNDAGRITLDGHQDEEVPIRQT